MSTPVNVTLFVDAMIWNENELIAAEAAGPVFIRVTSSALPVDPAAALTDWMERTMSARAAAAETRVDSPNRAAAAAAGSGRRRGRWVMPEGVMGAPLASYEEGLVRPPVNRGRVK